MFKIRLRDSFSSAHMLRGYQGDCERLHGHNYRIEVTICSPDLNKIGILADFRDIKQLLKDCLNPLDHIQDIFTCPDNHNPAGNFSPAVQICKPSAYFRPKLDTGYIL